MIDERIYREMEEYGSQGWTVVDGLVAPDFFVELEAACRRVKDRVRAGDIDVYTHWGNPGEPWCIRGLLAPDFGEPIFADYLLHKPFLARAHAYLGTELRLGWIDLRTNTHDEDLPGGWHRDLSLKEINPHAEIDLLRRPMSNLRWYLALVDDECLQIVPCSQHRPRTREEKRVLEESHHEDLSEQRQVPLRAGQVLFWDGNTVHRGNMRKDTERLTLAANWQRHSEEDEPVAKVDERFAWRLQDKVRAALPPALQEYYDRWRALQPA